MTNNVTIQDTMTVADLRRMLENVPDETVVWVYDDNEGTFTPAVAATHDKRVDGFNIWVNPS
jgi:hypothetical protein